MRIPVMTMNASITSRENSVSDLMVASLVLYKSFVARSGIMFSWHWVSCNLSISLVQLSRKRLKEYLYIFPCYNSFQNLITKNNVRASTFVVIDGSTVTAAILVNIIVVSLYRQCHCRIYSVSGFHISNKTLSLLWWLTKTMRQWLGRKVSQKLTYIFIIKIYVNINSPNQGSSV